MADNGAAPSILGRKTTRRAVIATAVAAGSVAAAYAALGDPLSLFGGEGGSSPSGVLSDTNAIKRESVRISHLLRRAGFGVSPDEFERYQSLGLSKTIDELVGYAAVDDAAAEALASQVPTDGANRNNLPLWWLVRMANTKRPLQEKMTLFWHGLLTSQLSVVQDGEAMLAQNEFFRTHALDDYHAILSGITMDRAMMVYLDMAGSIKRAPNENYARELMELFSMGVGNYTEQDIREAARAFTGWVVARTNLGQNLFRLEAPVFRSDRFDDGSKTFLGRSGSFQAEDVVSIIVEQPATTSFITRRLFSYFIYPSPDDKALAPFISVYEKTGRDIGAVVEAMLRSDVFYSPRAYRAIVKSPVEYVVSAVKALGAQESMLQVLTRARALLTTMGQIPFEPPNVAGWPGGPTWLNSATIFARLNFINQLAATTAGGGGGGVGPPPNLGTAAQALDYYLPLALDDNLPDAARQVLLDYASAGGQLTPELLRGVAYLVLASPQFQLS